MMYSILKSLINLFYPLKCQICKTKLYPENIWHICRNCMHKIRINLPPHCKRCGRTISFNLSNKQICNECNNSEFYFDRAWVVCEYKDVIKECIHLFKYNKKIRLLNLLSKLMHNFIESFINIDKIDIITAVPVHKSKLRAREFNQSQLIAESIAKRFNKPIIKENLNKIKSTPAQVQLNRNKRLSNLKDAFKVKDISTYKNKTVLLIDDVLTTGSTINECAKVLKEAQANKVYALVLARGN